MHISTRRTPKLKMSILGDCRAAFSASGAAYVGFPRSGSPHPLEQIDRAIVRDFGLQAVAGPRLQQNIGTADVPMDDGGEVHLVEVIEGSGHIQADGGELLW